MNFEVIGKFVEIVSRLVINMTTANLCIDVGLVSNPITLFCMKKMQFQFKIVILLFRLTLGSRYKILMHFITWCYTLIRLFVNTSHGQFPLRALLDPAAQGSLISEAAVQLLRLPKRKSRTKVSGVGNSDRLSRSTVRVELLSIDLGKSLSCTALVLPNISSYRPSFGASRLSLPKLEHGSLADPFYYEKDPIDILLGSDICPKIKIPAESFLHKNLFFQNTIFGWVFSGSSESADSNTIHFHNVNLENLLRSFWEQENVTVKRDLTNEELACENFFKTTTTRSPSGRYIVNLPFKTLLMDNSFPNLQNNMIGALKRFKNLESSFLNRPSSLIHIKILCANMRRWVI